MLRAAPTTSSVITFSLVRKSTVKRILDRELRQHIANASAAGRLGYPPRQRHPPGDAAGPAAPDAQDGAAIGERVGARQTTILTAAAVDPAYGKRSARDADGTTVYRVAADRPDNMETVIS